MTGLPGVYPAKKKDGSIYYRASITYRSKHISLGSYSDKALAHQAYQTASVLVTPGLKPYCSCSITDYSLYGSPLSFEKWVSLLNFRDNEIYCRTPIYLQHRYFTYYLDANTPLKFDTDDLFFYMRHKIMRRGGHLFVADYGMQLTILSRYGIHSYAAAGRDYRFVNGDPLDFRYANIEVINRYHGVTHRLHHGHDIYTARIHIQGDYIVGRYVTETEAAVAYNKAVHLLRQKGIRKNYPENFLEELNEREYARIYASVRISKKLRDYVPEPL